MSDGLRLVAWPMHVAERLVDEGFRTRDGHLIEALLRRDDVAEIVILDRPVTGAELATKRRRPAERIRAELRASRPDSKLSLVRLVSRSLLRPLVHRRGWWLHAYDPHSLTGASLRDARAVFRAADVMLVFPPTAAPLWSGSGTAVVQDLVDNWLMHPQLGQGRRAFERAYAEGFAAAAAVTANSEVTMALAHAYGRDAQLILNGVDATAFRESARRTAERWQRTLERFERPWLVYVGKLQDRLDRELVRALAERTSGSVILAGPVLNRRWIAPLRARERVHLLGDVAYGDVPGLMATADVALHPHRVGDGEIGGDPLKLYEYAAVGARIATTPVSAGGRVERIASVVAVGDDFIGGVESLGLDGRTFEARLRSSPVRDLDSWDARGEAMMRVLQEVAGWPGRAAVQTSLTPVTKGRR